MKLLGVLFVLFQLCKSKEISVDPDITAIYHVGRNNNDNYVDIHLRSNALGLPVAVGEKIIDPDDLEFHLDSTNLNTWEQHGNWTLVSSNTSLVHPSLLHKTGGWSNFHAFQLGIQINLKHGSQCMIFTLILTSDKISVDIHRHQQVYYIIEKEPRFLNILECSTNVANGDFTNDISDIRRKISSGSCRTLNSYIRVLNCEDSLKITQEIESLKLWHLHSDLHPLVRWNSKSRIRYYKILSSNNELEVVPIVQFLETNNEAQLISPPFIPKHKNLCFTVLYYVDGKTEVKSADVYVQDMLSGRVFVDSFIEGYYKLVRRPRWQTWNLIKSWPDGINSTRVRLLFEISIAGGSLRLESIASCDSELKEDVILLQNQDIVSFPDIKIKMPVFKPAADSTGPSPMPISRHTTEKESCSLTILQQDVMWTESHCVCPPGFVGYNCKEGCGQNSYGQDCGGKCSVHPTECSGLLLCTPAAGCFCAPGYTGKTCEEKCKNGTYGNNCTQICGHCEESACDIYTGKCSACLPGYQLPLCQEKYDYVLHGPIVRLTTFGKVTVLPNITNITDNAEPLFYTIQYKKQFGCEKWTSYSTYPIKYLPSFGSIRSVKLSVPNDIEGLEHGVSYMVRIVLINADFNSYEGEDIPAINFTSLCTIPENPDYDMEVSANQSSVRVSWKYPLENNVYWCPVEKFEVSWKGGWKWTTDFTNKTSYTIFNLLPGTSIKIKVRAVTKSGFAPFSPISEVSTTLNNTRITQPVTYLYVRDITSKGAKIDWWQPRDFSNEPLTYAVKYKCLKRVACQKQCADSTGELHVKETRISLDFLHPMSQYLVTVSADDGPTSSIFVGTKMTAPVEMPEPSSIPAVKTNTSVTVYWNKPEVCSGFFSHYEYQVYKVGSTQLLKSHSTVNTSAEIVDLHVSTEYRVLVYVKTSFESISDDKYLEINVSTSATVPDQVQNLTVYKKGRHLLGLRWGSPVNSYGPIVSFTIKYGHGETSLYKTEKIKPTQCVVWPNLFCHTIADLQADRTYTIRVSARNSEIDADGIPAEVQGTTKEKTPGPPQNLKLVNSTSSSFSIQWDSPWLINGTIRSFLVNVEETEQFEEEKCCQMFPIFETTVTNELEHYTTEVSGVHAASTYVVSISAKTVALGPSQTITVHTRPPPLLIIQLPDVVVKAQDKLTWQPQQPPFVNNSDVYKPLVKGSVILVVSNDMEFESTGMQNENLNENLRFVVPGNFYLAAEYTGEEPVVELGTNETIDSKWGEIHNMALQVNTTYKLAVVQITEYCGVYNFDVVWSLPFVAN